MKTNIITDLRAMYLSFQQSCIFDIDKANVIKAQCIKGKFTDQQSFLNFMMGQYFLKNNDFQQYEECYAELKTINSVYAIIYKILLKSMYYFVADKDVYSATNELLLARKKLLTLKKINPFHRFTHFHILSMLGTTYYVKRDFEAARKYSLMALRQAIEPEDEFLKIRPYKWLGYVALNTGNPTLAIKNYKKCEKIYQQFGVSFDFADLLNAWGLIYYNNGQYDEALHRFQQSHDIAKTYKYFNVLADAYNNLGITYYKLKEYLKAKECYELSLEYRNLKTSTLCIAYTDCNLGDVYLKLGQYDTAIEYYQNALAKAKKLKLVNNLPVSLHNNIAVAYINKQDYKAALKYLKKAEKLNSTLNSRDMLIQITNTYAIYYKETKKYKKAIEYTDIVTKLKEQP